MIDLTILGIALQGESQSPVLLLYPEGSDVILSLLIGPMEAFAISSGLAMVEGYGTLSQPGLPAGPARAEDHPFSGRPSRPMTHDLMLAVMHILGGILTEVDILGVENGVYMAEAVISTPVGEARIDCRPSDGVALAVRCGAALKVNEPVLAYGDSAESVLESLPEPVRDMVRANLSTASAPGKKSVISVTITPGTARPDPGKGEAGEKAPEGSDSSAAAEHSSAKKPGPKVISGAIPQTSLSPMTIMASLGENATEEERWAELLRQLSPETKEIM